MLLPARLTPGKDGANTAGIVRNSLLLWTIGNDPLGGGVGVGVGVGLGVGAGVGVGVGVGVGAGVGVGVGLGDGVASTKPPVQLPL